MFACLDGGKVPELSVEVSLHVLVVPGPVQTVRQLVLLLKLAVIPPALAQHPTLSPLLVAYSLKMYASDARMYATVLVKSSRKKEHKDISDLAMLQINILIHTKTDTGTARVL